MEDENGLELSLGLSCRGSLGREKDKSGTLHIWEEDTDRGSKIVDVFKNFLNPGMQRPNSTSGGIGDFEKPSENLFYNFSKASADVGAASLDLNARNLWAGRNYRTAETEEVKGPEPGTKHRMLFDEINQPERHEEHAHADAQDKNKMLHISITLEEGSSADNEDVADSEIEGSTSRLVAHDDPSVGCAPEFQKEVKGQIMRVKLSLEVLVVVFPLLSNRHIR